ncbi:hypothetical protein ABVK25_011927 [Lepraria finkii]|uniref:Uncharacterized protein n=1 Tax=Lepraria finkii TaxID=1340010 RepID=A0ABR4AM91_9LECA
MTRKLGCFYFPYQELNIKRRGTCLRCLPTKLAIFGRDASCLVVAATQKLAGAREKFYVICYTQLLAFILTPIAVAALPPPPPRRQLHFLWLITFYAELFKSLFRTPPSNTAMPSALSYKTLLYAASSPSFQNPLIL